MFEKNDKKPNSPIPRGARSSADTNRTRMTLDLSQKLNDEVERLAETNGTTKADILRFAIEFLNAATSAKEAGMHVGAWKEDEHGNRKEREFIGL